MRYKVITKESTAIKNLNRSDAVRYFCWSCSNFDRVEAHFCKRDGCRLHPYRGENFMNRKKQAQVIRYFCKECSKGNDDNCLKCLPSVPLAVRQRD